MTFTILHTTNKPQDGWINAFVSCMSNALHPHRVQYLLIVHIEDKSKLPELLPPEVQVVLYNGIRNKDLAIQAAHRQCMGDVIITSDDNTLMASHWDVAVKEAVRHGKG